MLHDLIVIVLVVAMEYVLLKTFSLIAPASFTAAVAKFFPTVPPKP